MKDVRVKRKQGISRAMEICIAICLLLSALVLYVFTRPETLPPPQPVPDPSVLLFEAEKNELLSFTVKPSRGQAYTIVKQGDGYAAEGYSYYDLNLDLINAMADDLLYLETENTLGSYTEDDTVDFEMFGLGDDALEIRALFTEGREYTLRIGSRIPGDTPGDYGMLQGTPSLYQMSITIKDAFDHPLTWLHNIPEVNFTPDLLESVRFERGKESLLLRRIHDDVWVMDEPFSYPVSMDMINQLKESVGKMRFASFIDLAGRVDLADYGLDQPKGRIVFDLAASTITSFSSDMQTSSSQNVEAQQIVIDIGHAVDNLGFYALYDGVVYQASNLSMGFMTDPDPDSYLSRYPVSIPLNRLNTFSATSEDGLLISYHVALVEDIMPNNEVSRDAQGDTLYKIVFTNEAGEEVPAEDAAELYKRLIGIHATGKADTSRSYEGVSPVFEARIQFGQLNREIKFYPYDALHAAIAVDGTVLYYTDLNYLKEAEKIMLSLSGK